MAFVRHLQVTLQSVTFMGPLSISLDERMVYVKASHKNIVYTTNVVEGTGNVEHHHMWGNDGTNVFDFSYEDNNEDITLELFNRDHICIGTSRLLLAGLAKVMPEQDPELKTLPVSALGRHWSYGSLALTAQIKRQQAMGKLGNLNVVLQEGIINSISSTEPRVFAKLIYKHTTYTVGILRGERNKFVWHEQFTFRINSWDPVDVLEICIYYGAFQVGECKVLLSLFINLEEDLQADRKYFVIRTEDLLVDKRSVGSIKLAGSFSALHELDVLRAIIKGKRPELHPPRIPQPELPGLTNYASITNEIRGESKIEADFFHTDKSKPEVQLEFKEIWNAGKPTSIGDYLLIDLSRDLLGASSRGFVIRTVCPDGQGGRYSCALKRFNTMDESKPDLARLCHPHVVHLFHHWNKEIDYGEARERMPKSAFMTFLMMELMDGDLGSLMASIKTIGLSPFSLLVAVHMMLQIAKGMLYLHEMGVSHPHLKCNNVLCRVKSTARIPFRVGDVLVKLGGFGCSRAANDDTKNRDVFCFGLTCLEILTGDECFEDIYGADKVSKPSIPETTPCILKDCIASCLDTNITFSEAITLLLLAQSQIILTCGDEIILCSVNLHFKSTLSNNQDLALSSTSKSDRQEMFHVHQLHPPLGEVATSVQITLIFFHGFPKVSEEWRMTWLTRDNRLVWPQMWLPEDLDGDIRVLSVSFDDRPNVNSSQSIKDLLQILVLSATCKLGDTDQAIVLVGHSFGGVIIKALVAAAQGLARKTVKNYVEIQEVLKCKIFLKKLASIVFYSVPHAFANMEFENYISGCSNTRVLQRSFLLKALRRDSVFISDMIQLSRDFENAVPRNTKLLAFLEGKPMSKKSLLVTENTWEGLLLSWEWHKIDRDNHFEICRPVSKSHIGYQVLLNHLQQHMCSPSALNVTRAWKVIVIVLICICKFKKVLSRYRMVKCFSAEDAAAGRLGKRRNRMDIFTSVGYGNYEVPMCRVEGCKADLSNAKDYYRRHKVCELHSKAPAVIVRGHTQRFCLQCSRFHHLGEFDLGKRSCRRFLAYHNRLRRTLQRNASTSGGTPAESTGTKSGDAKTGDYDHGNSLYQQNLQVIRIWKVIITVLICICKFKKVLSRYRMVSLTMTSEELLLTCATAIELKDVSTIKQTVSALQNMSSVDGEPSERVTAYFLQALQRRCVSMLGPKFLSGADLPSFHEEQEPARRWMLDVLTNFVDLSPYVRFGYVAANGAMLKAFEGMGHIHVLDFSTTHGMQWPFFIDALADRVGGPPNFRLTLSGPSLPIVPHPTYEEIGHRLTKYARLRNVPLEFNVLAPPLERLSYSDFDVRNGEALGVNFSLGLHYLADESAGLPEYPTPLETQLQPRCPRDNLLHLIRSLNPTIVTLYEEDCDATSTDVVKRVRQSYEHEWIPFDFMATLLPSGNKERQEYEKVVGMKIENIVACEGERRIERFESKRQWMERMRRLGFLSLPVGYDVVSALRGILDHSWGMKIEVDECTQSLLWKGHSLAFASAWASHLSNPLDSGEHRQQQQECQKPSSAVLDTFPFDVTSTLDDDQGTVEEDAVLKELFEEKNTTVELARLTREFLSSFNSTHGSKGKEKMLEMNCKNVEFMREDDLEATSYTEWFQLALQESLQEYLGESWAQRVPNEIEKWFSRDHLRPLQEYLQPFQSELLSRPSVSLEQQNTKTPNDSETTLSSVRIGELRDLDPAVIRSIEESLEVFSTKHPAGVLYQKATIQRALDGAAPGDTSDGGEAHGTALELQQQQQSMRASSDAGHKMFKGPERAARAKAAMDKSKRPRYTITTRSEVGNYDDGYKWRKYGQKSKKNSAHPRNYYSCTAANCPVRKRVERTTEDSSLVRVTYEGVHSHPAYVTHHSRQLTNPSAAANTDDIAKQLDPLGHLLQAPVTRPQLQQASKWVSSACSDLNIVGHFLPPASPIPPQKIRCGRHSPSRRDPLFQTNLTLLRAHQLFRLHYGISKPLVARKRDNVPELLPDEPLLDPKGDPRLDLERFLSWNGLTRYHLSS